MSVLFVSPAKQPCGIHDYSRALSAEIAGQGMDVRVAPPAQSPAHLKNLFGVAAECDLVHVQFDPAHWQDLSHNWYFDFAKQIRKPLIVTLHEVYDENPFAYPYSGIRSAVPGMAWIKRWIYRKRHPGLALERKLRKNAYAADALIVHNQHQKAILVRSGIKTEKIHVVPHGVWKAPTAPLRQEASVWRIGTFGFINPSSDFETVLQALSRLGLPWQYQIGGGPRITEHDIHMNQLLARINDPALRNRVTVTGRIPEPDLDAFFLGLDLYIAPFKFKSSSGSLHRAIAHGLPIIGPEIALIADLNSRMPVVAAYKPGDPDSLALVIETILTSPGRRAESATASRRYAQAFSFEHEAKETVGLYRMMVDRGSRTM